MAPAETNGYSTNVLDCSYIAVPLIISRNELTGDKPRDVFNFPPVGQQFSKQHRAERENQNVINGGPRMVGMIGFASTGRFSQRVEFALKLTFCKVFFFLLSKGNGFAKYLPATENEGMGEGEKLGKDWRV